MVHEGRHGEKEGNSRRSTQNTSWEYKNRPAISEGK